jgi:hypothetical protein
MSGWAKIKSVLRGSALMLSDELGMQLHDRETTGEILLSKRKSNLRLGMPKKMQQK